MKYLLSKAIHSESWFKCLVKDKIAELETQEFIDFNFKMKTTSFKKINLEEVDKPDEIDLDEGILWLLKFRINI